jgi:hypothetical protein
LPGNLFCLSLLKEIFRRGIFAIKRLPLQY